MLRRSGGKGGKSFSSATALTILMERGKAQRDSKRGRGGGSMHFAYVGDRGFMGEQNGLRQIARSKKTSNKNHYMKLHRHYCFSRGDMEDAQPHSWGARGGQLRVSDGRIRQKLEQTAKFKTEKSTNGAISSIIVH